MSAGDSQSTITGRHWPSSLHSYARTGHMALALAYLCWQDLGWHAINRRQTGQLRTLLPGAPVNVLAAAVRTLLSSRGAW